MSKQIPGALPQWSVIVEQEAKKHGLDASLVLSVIWQESSGDPQVVRYEPRFVWFFSSEFGGPLRDAKLTVPKNRDKALKILGEEEFVFQTHSHGLMQVMGSVGREFGYEGAMQAFYTPEINIYYGCKYLKVCLSRGQGDLRRGLLRWNGGGNPRYDDEVFEKYEMLKAMEV